MTNKTIAQLTRITASEINPAADLGILWDESASVGDQTKGISWSEAIAFIFSQLSVATTSLRGLMSAGDKSKLDKAIASDATGYAGAVRITQILRISQSEFDALPNAAKTDPEILWIII